MEVVIWKSKSHWKSNDFKIIFQIISKYGVRKLSHFDLKSWVTGGIKIRPNFLIQND